MGGGRLDPPGRRHGRSAAETAATDLIETVGVNPSLGLEHHPQPHYSGHRVEAMGTEPANHLHAMHFRSTGPSRRVPPRVNKSRSGLCGVLKGVNLCCQISVR
jgi:hypothetical protein